MLHPNQFEVNEAWIAFRLNDALIRTEADGDFNCVALMDASSCFILTTVLVEVNPEGPSKVEVKRLLKEGYVRALDFPKTLFVPRGWPANNLVLDAERKEITVVSVPEDQLLVFIGEARQGFKAQFG